MYRVLTYIEALNPFLFHLFFSIDAVGLIILCRPFIFEVLLKKATKRMVLSHILHRISSNGRKFNFDLVEYLCLL